MSIQFTFHPMSRFPVPFTKGRRRAPFKVTHDKTLRDLHRELGHLRAHSVAISLAVPASQIRRDNTPYATARPDHPGVVLSWLSEKTGPVIMPCDTYTEWTDNLRAITLALEALRAVDRYGVTRKSEQYHGWRPELPPPPGQEKAVPMTPENAAREFIALCGAGTADVLHDVEAFRVAYRVGAKKHHPDHNNSVEHPEWFRLQKTSEVLKRHHGIA